MEICVDSIESGLNAVDGGADRLELCSSLNKGGLTPTLGLFKTLKSNVSIPIFVMLRPRGGNDFQYSSMEKEVVLKDLVLFKEAGADGFVFGALSDDGDIDIVFCVSVILCARPLPVTFHRAFDVATADPITMARKISSLGYTRLLTSGRSPTAAEGKLLIKTLVEETKGSLIIVPGAGIEVGNLKDILTTTLAREFHGSAKVLKQYSNQNNHKLNSKGKVISRYVTHRETVMELLKIYKDYLNQVEEKNINQF